MQKNKSVHNLFITGLGLGYAPFAPGSVASLGGMALWLMVYALLLLLDLRYALAVFVYGGPWILLIIAWPYVQTALDQIEERDPSFIVIDEWVGLGIALTPLASYLDDGGLSISQICLAILIPFGLFRLFDIWKPGPIKTLEKMPGAAGVMMDDVLAGIFAWLVGSPILKALLA